MGICSLLSNLCATSTPKIDRFLSDRNNVVSLSHVAVDLVLMYADLDYDAGLETEASEVLRQHKWSLVDPAVSKIVPLLRILRTVHVTFEDRLIGNVPGVLATCVSLTRVHFNFQSVPQAAHLATLQTHMQQRPQVATALTLGPRMAAALPALAPFQPRALTLQQSSFPCSVFTGCWYEFHLPAVIAHFPLLQALDITGVTLSDTSKLSDFAALPLRSLTYGKFTRYAEYNEDHEFVNEETLLRQGGVQVMRHPISWQRPIPTGDDSGNYDPHDLTS